MITYKSLKWGYGVVLSLACGLSGCYMDGQNGRQVEYGAQHKVNAQQVPAQHPKETMVNAKQASKNPVQKSTPGPKQTAAPQLPVIQ